MKTITFLTTILSCCFALPTLDWTKVVPKSGYVEPLSNYSQSISPRIAGGRESTPNSRPYQAAILGDGQYFCGGSLISRKYVLTSALCIVNNSYFEVILGAHDIVKTEATQIRLTSTSAIVHSDYLPIFHQNDVGLLRLPTEVDLNNYIQLISLAPASLGTFENVTAISTGWGKLTDGSNIISVTLHEVSLTVMDNLSCRRIYGTNYIINSTLCTTGNVGVGICDGDAGGPLAIENMQIGIISFKSARGCEAGDPAGNARISSFRDWIVENAELPE